MSLTEDIKQAAGPALPRRANAPAPALRSQRPAPERQNANPVRQQPTGVVRQQPAGAVIKRLPVGAPAQKADIQVTPGAKRLEQRLTVIPLHKLRPADAGVATQMLAEAAESETKASYSVYVWFAICVLLPIALASVYFGLIASNQYAAEFRFTVQDSSTPSQTASGIMSMLGGGSSSNSNYMVTDYLTSPQVVEELQKRIQLETLYSKPDIDWWARFNRSQPFERFVQYWKSMVTAQYDMITGIATAEVRAFSPQDALLVANTLVTLSEELVNQVANRSQQDAVRFAQNEVDKAQERLKRVRADLTAYRNKFGIIDPTTSVAASNSSLTQTQRANLAQLETQLATLLSQRLASTAPAVVALKNQIKSTKEQLAKTEADVGKGNNGSALSTIVGDYEQLNLEVQFAQAMVTSTMQALDQARANAAAQHLYITPYVRPSLPESSTYPRRLLSVAMVGALAFAIWLMGLMMVRSMRERFG